MEEFDEIAGLTEEPRPDEETPAEETSETEEQVQETPDEETEDEDDGDESTVEHEGDDEEEPGPEEEDEESEEEDGGETPSEPDTQADPDVQAYLARFDGDTEAALKAAVDLQRTLGRQGREKGQLAARVQALEAELAQQQAFAQQPSFLTQEQQEWVGAALESGNPSLYVQQAVQVGEFDLARALADQWGQDQPYAALRAAQLIDNAEYMAQATQPVQAPVYEHPQFIADLTAAFPEMTQYEAQMVTVVRNLGDNHPLVAASRSPDPNEAVRGLVGIFEIARASSATVRSAKTKLKQKASADGAAVREAAVVTSGQASPAATESPRPRMIAPGLSLEALDAALEEVSR